MALFQEKCRKYIKEIHGRGKVPILVGGTGFYIQAVLYDIDFNETQTDTSYRKELQQFANLHGPEALHRELEKVDKKAAMSIHPNNVKRVIRVILFLQFLYI